MPLILVVEQEKRYVERIEQALGPKGWEIKAVADRTAAMRAAADRATDLVVINVEMKGAAELVETFSRAKGGPGAVILVPENSEDGVSDLGADEVLYKPFTDQDLSLAVRRCMAASREAAADPVAAEEERLTSEDIFGDVLLELESAFKAGGVQAPRDEEVEPEPPVEDHLEAESSVEGAEVGAGESEVVVSVSEVPADEIDAAADSPAEVAAEAASGESVEKGPEEPVEAEPEADTEELEEIVGGDETLVEVEEEAVEEESVAALSEEIEVAEEEATGEAEEEPPEKTADIDVDSARAADTLLDRALASLRSEDLKIDEEYAKPVEVTEEEIDKMLRTVVVGRQAAGSVQAPREASGAAEAVLEVVESGFEERDEGEYRSRMKLIWAILLLALAALLIYFVVRPAANGSEPEATGAPSVSLDLAPGFSDAVSSEPGRDEGRREGDEVAETEGESDSEVSDDRSTGESAGQEEIGDGN